MALQEVVLVGIVMAIITPGTSVPMGNIDTMSLLHLHFIYEVEWDNGLYPVWEDVER